MKFHMPYRTHAEVRPPIHTVLPPSFLMFLTCATHGVYIYMFRICQPMVDDSKFSRMLTAGTRR